MKNSLDGHDTRLKMAKGSMNWKKDQQKNIQSEEQRGKG